MLKPVTILALDDVAAPLAQAVQRRVASYHALEDLVQARSVARDDLAQTIQAVHAQRQRPESLLRVRDDVSTRELVLVMFAATGPARSTIIETTRSIREIYETRRFASLVTIELLCLLPEVGGATKPEDYAAAYALLKALSAEANNAFDEAWLLDAINAHRVKFGAVPQALDTYAEAIAGALQYEPEMSGALPGIHPRGMRPAFSSFGYASLVFPRDVALRRIESRFAVELIAQKLLDGEVPPQAQLAAKQFVSGEAFAMPLSRIGIDAGQSLFRRFQPKTQMNERTRNAEEVIGAVRSELQAFRDSIHLRNLDALEKHGQQTTRELSSLLTRTIDETLDGDGYDAALQLLDALLDPLPELRPNAEPAPRNLVTEIRTATAALDVRVRFAANHVTSDNLRERVRELETLIQDQKIVAQTHAPIGAADELAEMEREKSSLLQQIPGVIFGEERENSTARATARETEQMRLAAETEAKEQELRELFARLPRAEQALREALETRRSWLWQQLFIAAAGLATMIAASFVIDFPTRIGAGALALFAIITTFRHVTQIVPMVREARERLARVRSQISTTEQAISAARNAELQFEYDVRHRRTMLRVLQAAHDAATETRDAVRARKEGLEALSMSLVPESIVTSGLTLSIVDDAEVDAWFARTVDDRASFVREFPLRRSASFHLPVDEVRERITSYASTAFAGFRKLTLATAASLLAVEPRMSQRLKRFVDTSAPLIELRDDDLQAQGAMQRDATLWVDASDAIWLAQLQRRFPDAHFKPSPDSLSVHVICRVLHYPGYSLGQIEYYRAQYEASANPEYGDVADLLPVELVVGADERFACEQMLLARALGIPLSQLDAALTETRDITPQLRSLRQSTSLTSRDRNLLDGLLKKYATLV